MRRLVSAMSRRDIFGIAVFGACAFVMEAGDAHATPEVVAAEMKKLFGNKTAKPGKVKLDVPSIAENGLVVPLNFEVESPMTEKDHVKSVTVFADGNPLPVVAAFHFTPMSPKAAASIRMRLAKTQTIIAIAEMSNGELFWDTKEVKVTIGGCGG